MQSEKRARKGLDAIVVNDVSDRSIGFNSTNNAVTLIHEHGEVDFGTQPKTVIADQLIRELTPIFTANRAEALTQIRTNSTMSDVEQALNLDSGIFSCLRHSWHIHPKFNRRGGLLDRQKLRDSRVSRRPTHRSGGRDGRLSSPALRKALSRGLCEGGMDVICIGLCPHPCSTSRRTN